MTPYVIFRESMISECIVSEFMVGMWKDCIENWLQYSILKEPSNFHM